MPTRVEHLEMGRLALIVAVAVTLCLALLLPPRAVADSDAQHLSFFRGNRDFVLRAFERLPRQDDDAARAGRGWEFDPFAAWDAQAQVGAVRAALDTASAPEHLGSFRLALGELLDESAAAAARLDELDRLFRAHLRTALEVTLESRGAAGVQRVEAWLDGEHVADLVLSDAERAALTAGGVLEVVRRVVEPRSQELEVRLWLAGRDAPAIVTQVVEPIPDAVRHLRLQVGREDPIVHVVPSTLGGGR